MANKHLRQCSTLLAVREMQLKAALSQSLVNPSLNGYHHENKFCCGYRERDLLHSW